MGSLARMLVVLFDLTDIRYLLYAARANIIQQARPLYLLILLGGMYQQSHQF